MGQEVPEEPVPQVRLTQEIAPGSQARVTLESVAGSGAQAEFSQPPAGYESPPGISGPVTLTIVLPGQNRYFQWDGALRQLWNTRQAEIGRFLFLTGLLIYLAVRLVGLERYPIYFFTDEAVQTVLAADLVRDNLKNYAGEFLPTFFENGGKYRLGVSVYLQVIPYIMFGKSVFVTRAVSVLVTLLAAAAVGLGLRQFFRARLWWAGVLFLSLTPACARRTACTRH